MRPRYWAVAVVVLLAPALSGCAIRARIVDVEMSLFRGSADSAARDAADAVVLARSLLALGHSSVEVRHVLELRGIAPAEAERIVAIARVQACATACPDQR